MTVEAAKAEVGTAGVGTVAVEMEEAMGEGKVGVMEGVMAAEVMAVVETAEAVKGVEETEEGVREEAVREAGETEVEARGAEVKVAEVKAAGAMAVAAMVAGVTVAGETEVVATAVVEMEEEMAVAGGMVAA